MAGHLDVLRRVQKRRKGVWRRDSTTAPTSSVEASNTFTPFHFNGNKGTQFNGGGGIPGGDNGKNSNNGSDGHSNGKPGSNGSNNNNGNGNNGDSSDSSDSSDDDDESICGADGHIVPLSSGCMFINENDPSFQYTGNWMLTSKDPNGLFLTTHSTMRSGASVSISFNGTSITLVGSLPGPTIPAANYSVDGIFASGPQLPSAQTCTPNQPFFQSSPGLTPNLHHLTIDVTSASAKAPYIIDYAIDLLDCPHKPTAASSNKTAGLAPIDGVIIGAVLGGVALLVALGVLVWWLLRRKRQRKERLRRLQIMASPVSSWVRGSRSRSGTTMFTSTESIMRDNPTETSSVFPDPDDSSEERAVSCRWAACRSLCGSGEPSITRRALATPVAPSPPAVRSGLQSTSHASRSSSILRR
ncbi:uncharacterized protein BXZ73DRAFT_105676 [Epithele typhae]|uniref:uncharacterized protein n=1 Tax=Epithele typhae TaxID=378194 RepID=UPI002007D426|nr:uncharacterized protein BXZ73DRAFT_105676 [Epithele typhae]KAH9916983.1 hypothetical protein BXZ73DRAFT_105676 [Epithele typhae]